MPQLNQVVDGKGCATKVVIDETDQETKSTFSLLMELSRLELAGKGGPGPVLTLPLSGR